MGHRQGGADPGVTRSHGPRGRAGAWAPVSAQSSTALRGDASRPSCLDRGRRSTEHSTVVPNPRISAGSTVGLTGPAPALPRRQLATNRPRRRALDPAACADRCWVGGLLGGLDGASHAVTESQVARSIKTRRVCLAAELLDKSKSYQFVSAASAQTATSRCRLQPVLDGFMEGDVTALCRRSLPRRSCCPRRCTARLVDRDRLAVSCLRGCR